jgi:hypothetical protein
MGRVWTTGILEYAQCLIEARSVAEVADDAEVALALHEQRVPTAQSVAPAPAAIDVQRGIESTERRVHHLQLVPLNGQGD